MSLIYIFTFSKVETEQVARLMGAAVNGKPPARVGPSRVGANDLVLFASDMGPKIAKSLANSVLKCGAQVQGQNWQSEARCDSRYRPLRWLNG